MHPEAEAVEVSYEDGLLVIPTVPTVLDTVTEKVTNILAKIDRLPIEAIGEDLRGTLSRVRHLVEEAEIQTAIDALSSTLSEAEVLVGRLNDDVVPPLTTTLQQASQFSSALNTELTPQLSDVLRELQGAARAIRILSDYLEQHPDALIKGKK
jgi:paraquat-inducible protein B